ncbi:MAG: SRPBCC domain-containing protein [Candidatus Rokuibacteriota bacterium]
MPEPIHQEIAVNASPERVYRALTDAKQFGELTGAPAEIAPEAGGTFSCFGGAIVGRNLELVPNQRLVQAWRVTAWPPGVYSIVKFELQPEGSGTRVVLDHSAFPEDQRAHLDPGWHTNYWEPLKKHLEGQPA